MDKKAFLAELAQALSVLQEEELRDILDEYEQHIDMKVENGLTEQEAIEDFGSLTELTAEILEAYHVRADYASGLREKGDTEKRDSLTEQKEWSGDGKRVLESGVSLCKHGCMVLGRGIEKAGMWIWGVLGWTWHQACRPFLWSWRMGKEAVLSWRKRRLTPGESQGIADSPFQRQGRNSGREDGALAVASDRSGAGQAENSVIRGRISDRRGDGRRRTEEDGRICRMLGAAGHGISHMVSMAVKAAFWCVRAAWNACCIGGSLMIAFFGLFCLYGFGVLVILLADGYPLLGATLGCFGLVLCTFSAAGFVLTLLWKQPGRQQDFQGKDRSEKGMDGLGKEGELHA